MPNIKHILPLFLFAVLYHSQGVYAQADAIIVDPFSYMGDSAIIRQQNIDVLPAAGRGASKNKGDKLYNDLGYMAATEYYQKLDGDGKLGIDEIVKLANSFRLNSKFPDAEYWYARCINQVDDPVCYLHFAQVLQSNRKCEDAVRWYQKYNEIINDTNRSFIEDCEEIKHFANDENIEIKNLESLNSKHIDYCAIPYEDGLMFTSTRGTANTATTVDIWTSDHFSDLYFAKQKGDGIYDDIKAVEKNVNDLFHDGVATFDKSATRMIFSRNNKKGKSSKGIKGLKLYEAEKINDKWTNIVELPFNSHEFTNCHPTLSEDGRRLYFSSDRPGGFGDMDLYVSVHVGGAWREPQNLGPMVNSSGNDLFPFLNNEDELYYASNGHKGLGGLDIFKVTKADEDDENSWNFRENMGKPFNSEKDDFGFYINEDNMQGFLTSNRPGGLGADDIYKWENKGPVVHKKKTIKKEICIYNEQTGERIIGAKVAILEASESWVYTDVVALGQLTVLQSNSDPASIAIKVRDNIIPAHQSYQTNKEGVFVQELSTDVVYTYVIEMKGYKIKREILKSVDMLKQQALCITMEPRNCLLLDGLVKNKDLPKYIPNATVTLINKCNGEETTLFSDANGAFDVCLECGCEYLLRAQKKYFHDGTAEVSTVDIPCDQARTINTEIALEFKGLDENQPTAEALNNYFLGAPEANYHTGQIITLHHLYYNFDKYNIRKDASEGLDHLAALMHIYPSMEISLFAHTDSRGRDRYNKWLSRKRAKSAKEYLIAKGVHPYRIHDVKGFGEARLVNRCVDGMDCSEYEHQLNRRTEIIIERFDAGNVTIQYAPSLGSR